MLSPVVSLRRWPPLILGFTVGLSLSASFKEPRRRLGAVHDHCIAPFSFEVAT